MTHPNVLGTSNEIAASASTGESPISGKMKWAGFDNITNLTFDATKSTPPPADTDC